MTSIGIINALAHLAMQAYKIGQTGLMDAPVFDRGVSVGA